MTYRARAVAPTIDGCFSPSTKTPHTDELQFQYEVDLGNSTSARSPTTTARRATSSKTP